MPTVGSNPTLSAVVGVGILARGGRADPLFRSTTVPTFTPGRCRYSTGPAMIRRPGRDSAGRIVVPKPLRDALALTAGATVDISQYGSGLQIVPAGRTARLVEEDGFLVATGDNSIDDDIVLHLIDASRR